MESSYPKFDPESLHDLAADILDGTASQQQRDRLEALLTNDSAARRVFLDYMLLHAELSLTAEEMLAEQGIVDEPLRQFVVSGGLLDNTATNPKPNQPIVESEAETNRIVEIRPGTSDGSQWQRNSMWSITAVLVAVAACFLVFVGVFTGVFTAQPIPIASSSYYNHQEFPRAVVATLQYPHADDHGTENTSTLSGGKLNVSTLRQKDGESRVAFAGGADVRLLGPTVFGVESRDAGVLLAGAVSARLPNGSSRFSVQTSHVRVVDKGSEFQVNINQQGDTEVESLVGEVEVQTLVRLPRYYWNFEDAQSLRDVVQGEVVQMGPATKYVPGLIGNGALAFDNTPMAYGEVLGGKGDEVGTGGFAVSHGVSIEVVCTSSWTGKWQDYDEIFRKEDGNYRMLLSFQHDNYDYSVPPISPGPCLSFGLHLAGQGYSELDMPLDGKDGRPTLAEMTDGHPHHIVATYDFFTGNKAIYIDGRLRFEHTFPKGTLILSGGPSPARIGNLDFEPYSGVIDELAYYDFALTPDEIANHYERVSQGKDYFGIPASDFRKERWVPTTIVAEGERKSFRTLITGQKHRDS